MPDIIRHLPQDLINQIAAGEVVERPASVLKELVENSIDAGSTKISILVDKGGTGLISVSDDGIGMSGRDAKNAFERHATSKLESSEDLFNIHTLGFRGEALSSIAAVARVCLKTRERNALSGRLIEVAGGSILKNSECGCPCGTEIEVRDLFYNVPARRKFLKTVSSEHRHILSSVIQQALAHINIHFILASGEDRTKVIYDLPPVDAISERVLQVHGRDISEGMIPFSFEISEGSIYGMASNPAVTFRSRENQLFFVNKRAIKNPSLSHAVQEAYRDLISKESSPMVFLFIDIAADLVDVNVHPTKREVRFRDSRYIHDMVVEAIRGSLKAKGLLHGGNTLNFSGIVSPVLREAGRAEKGYPDEAVMNRWLRNDDQNMIPLKGRGRTEPGVTHENMTVSEGFNPFSGERNCKTQEMYTEPLVRIMGQTGALFIVAEIDGALCIIDQHAAHERVIYDRLRRGHERGGSASQVLLIPETFELSIDKAYTLCEYKEFLNALGFDIGEIGERSFIVRSVPEVFTGEDYKSLLINMTDEIKERDFSNIRGMKLAVIEEVVKALLSRKACHSAVRARGLLTSGEMLSLVTDLLHTDMPYTCPHGRPIVRRFAYDELERMFGRQGR